MDLMSTLGLDEVSADPNRVPDNSYDCIVASVEYVHLEGKNRFSDVITYQVTNGENKGARIAHWFNLGSDPTFDAQGNPTGYKPTMSDGQKSWYKKAFTDLGIPEAEVNAEARQRVVGRKCVVTVKTSNGYQNVNRVQVTDGSVPAAQASPEFTASNAGTPGTNVASGDLASQL